MKIHNRLLSMVLATATVIAMLSFGIITGYAENIDLTETGATGTTGDCTWTLNGSELIISGNGAMKDYNVFGAQFGQWGDNNAITDIIISDGVTSIGDGSFYNCNNLKSVTIPDSVTRIGTCAFCDCKGLEHITIGSHVTDIGNEAFRYCSQLSDIDIPDSVLRVGSNAFIDTEWYDRQPDGLVYAGKVVCNYKGDYPAEITIKDGTRGIAKSAFSNYINLEKVTIPDSVTYIGDSAFSFCEKLQSVIVPASVEEIGKRAFGLYLDWTYGGYKPIEGFTVYGYYGTEAERYADDNGLIFVALEEKPVYLGDADGDGQVTILDATQIQKKLAQLPTVSSFNESAACIDGEKLNILHATYIQKYLAKLPCPKGIGDVMR